MGRYFDDEPSARVDLMNNLRSNVNRVGDVYLANILRKKQQQDEIKKAIITSELQARIREKENAFTLQRDQEQFGREKEMATLKSRLDAENKGATPKDILMAVSGYKPIESVMGGMEGVNQAYEKFTGKVAGQSGVPAMSLFNGKVADAGGEEVDQNAIRETVRQKLGSSISEGGELTRKAFNLSTKSQEEAVKKANFYNSTKLRQEFLNRPEVKDYISVSTNVRSMDSLLNKALSGDEGNKVSLDQALITMYNKLTDPNSVVRESEYARTPENLPLVNRLSGAIKKINQGGAGLTNDDRAALVWGAKVILDERGKTFNDTLSGYKDLAGEYGVNPDLILRGLSPHKRFNPELNTDGSVNSQDGQYQIGQEITNKQGRKFRVIGYYPDGEPNVEPVSQ